MTDTPLARTVARVEATTLALGAAGAIYEWIRVGWRAALALAVGAVISWLNYRWLRSGVTALAPAPDASAQPQPTPAFAKTFLKFFGRIVLLLVALYVILSRSLLPSTPLLAGLFASVAAVMLQTVFLLARGGVAKSG
jgi:hypothetical protein